MSSTRYEARLTAFVHVTGVALCTMYLGIAGGNATESKVLYMLAKNHVASYILLHRQ